MSIISLEGTKELAARFNKINADMQVVIIQRVLDLAAEVCAEEMRNEAPARTGYLRESVDVYKDARKPYERDVKPRAPHAHFIEFGTGERFRKSWGEGKGLTGHVTPNPFMRRAAQSPRIQEAAAAEFKNQMMIIGAL